MNLLDKIEKQFRAGAPKEIRVSNVIIEAIWEQICKTCNIKLLRVKRLNGIDGYWTKMMTRYR